MSTGTNVSGTSLSTEDNDSCSIFTGRVLFFNEINGTGYIEQQTGTEKLRFTYKHILKEGYRAVYEGELVHYGTTKVGTGTRITFVRAMVNE